MLTPNFQNLPQSQYMPTMPNSYGAQADPYSGGLAAFGSPAIGGLGQANGPMFQNAFNPMLSIVQLLLKVVELLVVTSGMNAGMGAPPPGFQMPQSSPFPSLQGGMPSGGGMPSMPSMPMGSMPSGLPSMGGMPTGGFPSMPGMSPGMSGGMPSFPGSSGLPGMGTGMPTTGMPSFAGSGLGGMTGGFPSMPGSGGLPGLGGLPGMGGLGAAPQFPTNLAGLGGDPFTTPGVGNPMSLPGMSGLIGDSSLLSGIPGFGGTPLPGGLPPVDPNIGSGGLPGLGSNPLTGGLPPNFSMLPPSVGAALQNPLAPAAPAIDPATGLPVSGLGNPAEPLSVLDAAIAQSEQMLTYMNSGLEQLTDLQGDIDQAQKQIDALKAGPQAASPLVAAVISALEQQKTGLEEQKTYQFGTDFEAQKKALEEQIAALKAAKAAAPTA